MFSKGHPLGATGLAQCCELVWQLRGEAEKRQVKNARVCLQHNLGLGGAAVVTMYERPKFGKAPMQLIPNKSRSDSIGTPSAASPASSTPSTASAAPAAAAAAAAPKKSSGFAAETVFAGLAKAADAAMVKKVNAIFRFDIKKGSEERSWIMDLKNGSGSISDAADFKGKSDCTIAISDDDFVSLMTGKLNAMQACQFHLYTTYY